MGFFEVAVVAGFFGAGIFSMVLGAAGSVSFSSSAHCLEQKCSMSHFLSAAEEENLAVQFLHSASLGGAWVRGFFGVAGAAGFSGAAGAAGLGAARAVGSGAAGGAGFLGGRRRGGSSCPPTWRVSSLQGA